MTVIQSLIAKGVRIPAPQAVEIGPEVDPERVSGEGVVIHAGCRIGGRRTLIAAGARIGAEGPATIEECLVGPGVALRGGYFRGAVFLEGASCGSAAHVREGTILEEQASTAHAVGLKQTILFPFVTLGSLINFCDCLMAGGTDRKNHSEVGSSYIHFNFTPNQDKATASLFGDVPRGVMLNQPPIFLGGQGGAVGPLQIAFGVTAAAGTILRKDERRTGRLIYGGAGKGGNVAYTPGSGISGAGRIVSHNCTYIGNLFALREWYRSVRPLFTGPRLPQALLDGLLENIDVAIEERIKRLKELFKKPNFKSAGDEASRWLRLFEALQAAGRERGDNRLRETFLKAVENGIGRLGRDYLAVIRCLPPETAEVGTRWLQGIVDRATAAAEAVSLRSGVGSGE